MSDGLDQKCFAHAGRAQQQHIRLLAEKMAAGQIVDLLALDRWVEGKVEFIEVFDFAE